VAILKWPILLADSAIFFRGIGHFLEKFARDPFIINETDIRK
jgi:hypothetical protein